MNRTHIVPCFPLQRKYITVTQKQSLAAAVRSHISDPRLAEQVLNARGVWIDKKRMVSENQPVPPGCTLRVFIRSDQYPGYTIPAQDIIFEDEHLMLVFKPAGLNVQPDPAGICRNLTWGVQQVLQSRNIAYVPCPITRLDLPVSGLVLFAKSKKTEKKLFALSRERKIHKWYHIVTAANPDKERLMIADTMGWQNRKAVPDAAGKIAESLFVKTAVCHGRAVYSVFLFTGRRHQIRFHASRYLAPVFGDTRYNSPSAHREGALALLCRGYNFILDNRRYRVRLPATLISEFNALFCPAS